MPRIFDRNQLVRMEVHQLRDKVVEGQVIFNNGRAVKEPTPGETVVLWLRPLTAEQKAECFSKTKKIEAGVEVVDRTRLALTATELTVKKVENLFSDSEGKVPWQVEVKDGRLTPESLSNLLNAGITGELLLCAEAMLAGVPNKVHTRDGSVVENVTVVLDQKPEGEVPN